MERPLPRLAESLTENVERRSWWSQLFGEAADEEVEAAASHFARTMLAEAGESEEVRLAKQVWNDPNASRAELVEAEQTLRYAGGQGRWQGGIANEEPHQDPIRALSLYGQIETPYDPSNPLLLSSEHLRRL